MILARYETRAWAVDLRLNGRPGFRGNATPPIPIGLWSTRRQARAALSQWRSEGGEWAREHYWNCARVVPVTVTLRSQG